MKHLIVGSGNMGKRHGAILNRLGDVVKYVDLGWIPKSNKFNGIDSILICTPPGTHCEYYNALGKEGKPVFVEKPIITSLEYALRLFSIQTMVACNWRYCDCAEIADINRSMQMSYAGAIPLDFIHFYDLACYRYGEELDILETKLIGRTSWVCSIKLPKNKIFSITLTNNAKTTSANHQLHRNGYCGMFVKQMRQWREIIRGSVPVNPIDLAVKRTSKLIESSPKIFRD